MLPHTENNAKAICKVPSRTIVIPYAELKSLLLLEIPLIKFLGVSTALGNQFAIIKDKLKSIQTK